jgi:uncharacterized membrane protein
MSLQLIAHISLTVSVVILVSGLVLFIYRNAVSAWAIEMLKTHNSFLLSKENLTEITIIAILLIIIGLGYSVAYIFYSLSLSNL